MSQKFLLALNIISLVAIIGITANLTNLNNKINNLKTLPNVVIENSAVDDKTNNKQPVQIQKKIVDKNLEITDQGYSPSGVQIYGSQITVVKILNSGQNPHSFIINELDINIDPINAGETAEIVIDREFAESKNYTFYSNAEGDDPQTFTGVLMVLK